MCNQPRCEKPKRRALGRNQRIAMWGYGLPLVATYALILAGKLDAAAWVALVQVYVPIAMATTLGIAGTLKAVETVKGVGAPPAEPGGAA